MKKYNLFTASALAAMMLFSACSKDNEGPGGGGEHGGYTEGIPTYATVTLSQKAGASTYAATDYANPESNATAEEKTVNNAFVIVFNQFGIFESLKDLENKGDDTNPKWEAQVSTTTGKKTFLALANLSDNAKGIVTAACVANATLDQVINTLQKIETIAEAATDNSFWMSNVYPLNATSETMQDVVDEHTKITIYIGRMTAKVTPTFNIKEDPNAEGKLNPAGAQYRVRNNPKRFFSFPVYNAAGLLTSPYYDRNYTDGGSYDADGLGAGDYFDNGHDANDADGIAHTFVAAGTDSYLTENSPKEAKRHKVTFLSIKAKWEPNENATFLAANGTKMDAAAGMEAIKTTNQGTFYRVQKWKSGKIEGYCPGIYTAQPTAFHKEIIDDATDGAQNELVTREVAKADQTADTKYVVATYTNGIAYWPYWMKNSNEGTVAQKYALKRNNHFKVNIISVAGVGDPVEDDILDKDEDIEKDVTVTATIEVLNWNEVTIEGGI